MTLSVGELLFYYMLHYYYDSDRPTAAVGSDVCSVAFVEQRLTSVLKSADGFEFRSHDCKNAEVLTLKLLNFGLGLESNQWTNLISDCVHKFQ